MNAIQILESISLLLFKPGFCVQQPQDPTWEPNFFAIDDDIVWREGISVNEAPNHKVRTFDSNRISLLHLLIALLSQPLFYSPEEYLTVLNPFSTYLTSRKCKNVKNLFVSLLNVVLSYDTKGYGIPYVSAIDTQGEVETLTNQCLHLFLIMIEYKPPSIDNLQYLIDGGHPTLKKVYTAFKLQAGETDQSQ